MAWNEPGGSGDKDPWGNRNNDQGPPDLDEVIRNFQKKLGRLFGKKGGGGSSGTGGSAGGIGLGVVAAIALVIWALSGIYIIETGTQGVVLQFGKFKEITNPGPHWYPRFIQTVEIVNVDKSRSARIGLNTSEALMLTEDENIVDIKLEVQYKVQDPKDYLFNVSDPVSTLKQATESALREVVGKNTMDFILTTGRSDVANLTEELLQDILDRYNTGLLVTEVNLVYTEPPEQVKPAFLDASSAREDKVRYINEAQAYANDILPKARGQAARLIQEAEAYRVEVEQRADGDATRFLKVLEQYNKAPEVTRERMYIDAMEEVLSNSSKVMIDVKQGNSLMYLPIDKLMQQSTSGSTSMNNGGLVNTAPPKVRGSMPTTRSRDRVRSREVRK